MAKSSTLAEAASRLTVGIDVGDKSSRMCFLDEEAEVIEETQIPTTEAAFRRRFADMEPCLTVMEVGTHSPWLSRLLESLGHECLVANPASLRQKRRNKSDRIDAEKLARRGRADPRSLEPVQHAGADVQADMALIHSRRSLVEARTKLINRARGLVKSFGCRLPECDADYFALRAKACVPEQLQVAVEPLLRTIAGLSQEIDAFDKQIDDLAEKKYKQATDAMRQVKGVGSLISVAYALTVRDPRRFKHSRQVGPYLGLTPRQDQSGERDEARSITKAGNVYLRQLLLQSANYILGPFAPDSDLRRWGLRKAEGGKKARRRAKVAVARKLAVLMHHLWLNDEVYEPLYKREEATITGQEAQALRPEASGRPVRRVTPKKQNGLNHARSRRSLVGTV